MNALSTTADFTVVPAPETQWLVLQCGPSRTLALAAALADFGAWTPTWRVSRQAPRSSVRRMVTEPCIAGFVFVPEATGCDLPVVPLIRFWHMRGAERQFIRVPDRQLNAIRSKADRPKVPASKLPKPGARIMMPEGPWQGLRAVILACSHKYARLAVDGWPHEVKLATCFLPID